MLIGLAGRAGVGKTTIAKMLEDLHGFKILSFATPMKKALVEMTGLPIKFFTDVSLKETEVEWIGKSPRQLMQALGTDFVREMVHPDFWRLRMREEIYHALTKGNDIVIDDCRFENETQLIRDLDGTVVHLRRDYAKVTQHEQHPSEATLKMLSNDLGIQSGEYGKEWTYSQLHGRLLQCV